MYPPQTAPCPDDTGHLPLFDPTPLDGLLVSLDCDEDAVDGFVATFIAHWPERLRRAEDGIAAHDNAAIYDSALSIKVAGQMVGAVRLSALGGELERIARSGRRHAASAILDAMRAVGDGTIRALTAARSRASNEHVA